MSVSTIYYQIYTTKFGKNNFVHIYPGFVKSSPVYLKLDDLDLVEDLGNILDFYRDIEQECEVFMINFLYSRDYFYISRYNTTCNTCKKITCQPLLRLQKILPPSTISLVCEECYSHIKHYDNYKLNFDIEVMNNFNFYEWVPVNNFLENRNPSSDMFMRRMSISKNDDDCITLKLINKNVKNLNSEDTIFMNYVYQILEEYNVAPHLDKKIITLLGIRELKKSYQRKQLSCVIIDSI